MTLSKEQQLGLALLVAVILLWWYLHSQNLLHESVSANIITGDGTISSDAVTGLPRYDSRNPATIPASYPGRVDPIDAGGHITAHPANIQGATCPIGFSKWIDAADGSVHCLPDGHLEDVSKTPTDTSNQFPPDGFGVYPYDPNVIYV